MKQILPIDQLVHAHWGKSVKHFNAMEGYDSTNYKIVTDEGLYVLKIYTLLPSILEVIEGENEVLQHLESNEAIYPRVIASISGHLTVIDPSKEKCYRLLTFLNGTFWGDVESTERLYISLGRFLAHMDLGLSVIAPIAMRAKRIPWDLDEFLSNESMIDDVIDPSDRHLIAYFFLQYKQEVLPRVNQLRKSLIHNDANDWNVLIDKQEVSGIIDFGDMVYSSLINELAVALAYALMDSSDPIEDTCTVVRAYHEIYPLETTEIEVLYYLIAARLCTSLVNSAHHKKKKPDSSYITVSEAGAWALLKKWLTISPYRFENALKSVVNVPLQSYRTEEIFLRRKKVVSGALSLSYQRPIHMKSAAFQYMYDAKGNAILDAYNNIKHVGHCHPHVVSAGQNAMAQLNTNSRYLYDSLVEYSELLLSYFPDSLCKVFLVNSGSAASDLAIRMARCHTGRDQIAVIEHGYHGNSSQGIDISHYKYAHKGGSGRKNYISEVPMPDTYRGRYREELTAGTSYATDFKALYSQENFAAFIAEPIIGCGGQVPLAKGFLSAIYPFIRGRGGVCISDEVQTGFGRVGSHFWGYERYGVVPDIVVLGKPIGNGHPMAAVVCTDAIAQSFDNGMEFFSSFGGNPVSCSIGKAVLEVIEMEGLQKNALTVGEYMMDRFRSLQDKYEVIGDVRGAGLFIGVDLIKANTQCKTDRLLAKMVKNELRDRNILVSSDGPDDNVIKIKPPMCFNQTNVDTLLDNFEDILKKI